MNYSKFFELLLKFSSRELDDLVTFAGLSMHQLPEQDMKVLKAITALVTPSTEGVIDEKAVEEKIFSKFFADVDEKKAKADWNHTKSRLSFAVNRFIAFLEIEKDDLLKDQLLLNYYQKQQLERNYKALLKKNLKVRESNKHDFDKAYKNYKLQEVVLNHEQGQRRNMDELARMNTALDNFYFENKLRMMVEQYNRHRIINEPEPNISFIQWLDAGDQSRHNFGVQLFRSIYSMMQDPDNHQHYYRTKALFLNNIQRFSLAYKRSICDYLMNQCIYYCHQGHIEFASEYMELIRYAVSELFAPSEGGLSVTKYSNTIYMGLVSDYLDWTEDFVETYSSWIDHPKIGSIKNLNLANVYFHQGKFAEAQELLLNYDYFELYFKITYDKLYIKLYFEEDEGQALISKLLSFERYIQRSTKLSDDRKEKNFNFINAVRQLWHENGKATAILKDDFLILDYLWLEKKWNMSRPGN